MPPAKSQAKSDESENQSGSETQAPPPAEGDKSQAGAPAPPPSVEGLPDGAPQTMIAAVQAARDTSAGKDETEPLSRLIEEASAFFDVEPHVAAGAFHFLPQCDITELTRKQGRAVIDAWLAASPEVEAV